MKRFGLFHFNTRRRLSADRRRFSARLRRFESLEGRNLLATLTAGLDSSGNFLVTDSAGDGDDSVVLYRSGANIVAFSEDGIDANGVNQTAGENSVSVPLSAITGQIIVNLGAGQNQLLVSWDFQDAGGAPAPTPNGDPTVVGGISYTVVNDDDDDDSLTVAYAGSTAVTVNYSVVTSIKYGGSVRVGGTNGAIHFSNVDNAEGAALTLEGAENVVLNLPGRSDRGVLDVDTPTGGIMLTSDAAGTPTLASTVIDSADAVALVVNLGPDSGRFSVAAVRTVADEITINGQAGNDTILIGTDTDPIDAEFILNGGDGNDTIVGSEGAETITGGMGDDSLSGGDGDDLISGGEGRDRLVGGAGNDELRGEGGDDTLFGDEGGAIPIDAGGDDTLIGGLGIDILNGETGDDSISGNEGNDIIRIMADHAVGDTMVGGAGTDSIEFIGDAEEPVILSEFGGASTLIVGQERIVAGGRVLAGTDDDNNFNFSSVTLVSVFAIHGLGGNDIIIGSKGNDLIYGHSPGSTSTDPDDDELTGGPGNDSIVGGPGDDVLVGGIGNDILNGGVGEDDIDGGVGNDVIEALEDEAEFDMLQGGGGNDSLVNLAAAALVLNGFVGSENGLEVIRGNSQPITGNDEANTLDFRRGDRGAVALSGVTQIRGGDGDDTIYGGSATDSIFGDDGADELFGGGGNDVIFGGDGDDIIRGEAGVDTIDGGVGEDLLYGGESNDIFVFNFADADDEALDKVMDYRNDFLSYVGYASTGFPSAYAAIRSESISGGVQVVQSVSGKKVELRGTLRLKPASSRFNFVTAR
jgi:Ca2+-binding RTX toxin-like protein